MVVVLGITVAGDYKVQRQPLQTLAQPDTSPAGRGSAAAHRAPAFGRKGITYNTYIFLSLSLSLSIYIYICMYMYIHIYIYIYIYMYIYIYTQSYEQY